MRQQSRNLQTEAAPKFPQFKFAEVKDLDDLIWLPQCRIFVTVFRQHTFSKISLSHILSATNGTSSVSEHMLSIPLHLLF